MWILLLAWQMLCLDGRSSKNIESIEGRHFNITLYDIVAKHKQTILRFD